MPGTAMAEAFQEAGFYEGGYEAEGQPGEEQVQEGEGEPAQDTAAAEGGQEAGDDTLENIVEDLKRKNAGE